MNVCPKMRMIVSELASKHAINLDKPGAILWLEMKGFDRLRIERLANGCLSVAHVFQTGGHSIPEPDVCFFVNEEEQWIPVNITQSIGGFRAYAELSADGSAIVRYSRKGQTDLALFCEQWAQNLRDQRWLENATRHQLSGNHRFALGQIVATPGVLAALEKTGQTGEEFISRHVSGDWGTLPPEDMQANDDALSRGGRIFSAYILRDGTKIWLITESDRSASTLLLPDDY